MEVYEKLTKQISETKYLSAENSYRYRPIMRCFYYHYERLEYWLYKEDVYNELKENDMLPSIRNLAKDLRISILTVKKAYDELEQEAYIKTVQGKGTFVTPRNTELIREKQISIIENHIEQIINIAKISNISKNEIIDLFNYLYEEE